MRITVAQLRRLIREKFSLSDLLAPLGGLAGGSSLTDKQQIAAEYADLYMEKYGTAPPSMDWDRMSDEEAQARLERLVDEPENEYEDWDVPDLAREGKQAVKESTQFPTWEEYSTKEQIASIYSDVYKEKHGIRPRWMNWDGMTDEEAQAELDRLYAEPSDNDVDDEAGAESMEANFPPMEPDPNAPEEDEDPYEKMPSFLGMGREPDSVGYEKRQGDFAGNAGRKLMKVFKGR